MTITVTGKLIQDAAELSALGRLALAFVDGGTQWLHWATTHPAARYAFDDETHLVGAVQVGLHAAGLALLPGLGLLVSPVKLMSLGLADLRILAKAEETAAASDDAEAAGAADADSSMHAAQLRRVLADHRLLTQRDLSAGNAFLSQLGAADAPVFQTLAFADRLALCDLLHWHPSSGAATPELEQEAARFALRQAHTPQEFCDYFKVYLSLTYKLGEQDTRAANREASAEAALQALLPLLFQALDCPQLTALPPSPDRVARAVADWIAQGKRIGFPTLSQGLLQLIEHSSYRAETGEAAQRIVHIYLDAAQTLLAAAKPRRARMGQDGVTCTFELESGELRGKLEVGPSGTVALRAFGAHRDAELTSADKALASEESTI